MNLPDELFENTNSLELYFDKRDNGFWRITTNRGVGRGKTLDEAVRELQRNEKISNLQIRLTKFVANISPLEIDALNIFLNENE